MLEALGDRDPLPSEQGTNGLYRVNAISSWAMKQSAISPPLELLASVWRNFKQAGCFLVLSDTPDAISMSSLVSLNSSVILLFSSLRTLPFVGAGLLGIAALAEACTYPLFLTVSNGREYSGSCFVGGVPGHRFVVTAAHHFDSKYSNQSTTIGGDEIVLGNLDARVDELNDIWVGSLDSTTPLAIPLTAPPTSGQLLSEVLLAGFPRVPGALSNPFTVRTGQVVGQAQSYLQKSREVLLHSATNHPGNSGGPVLDSRGFCVGVSTDNFLVSDLLEPAEDEKGAKSIQRLPFHVATPVEFVTKLVAQPSRPSTHLSHQPLRPAPDRQTF